MEAIFTMSMNTLLSLLQWNTLFALKILGILLGIHIINIIVGYRLIILGIYPRRLFGLIGIAAAPFIHANFSHLFFNAIPLFVLANFILLQGVMVFFLVTIIIAMGAGLFTWFLGRSALHVGASGIIMGYWSYLLAQAYYHPSLASIGAGLVGLYYFGSFFLDLLPGAVSASWESHLGGFLSGIGALYLLPYFPQLISSR